MNLRIAIGGAAVVGIVLMGTDRIIAQTNSMQSGNWSDTNTWSAGEPDLSTAAVINGGHTVTIDQASEVTNLLDVGTIANETGNVHITTGGDLFVSDPDDVTLPNNPAIRLGQAADSTGNLTMDGGNVFIDGPAPSAFEIGDLMVGTSGTGTATLTGGTMFVIHEVAIGFNPGSSGRLEVSGDAQLTLGVQNMLVGWEGSAELVIGDTALIDIPDFWFSSFFPGSSSTITQTGGELRVVGAVVMARQDDSTYDHSGGAINADTIVVADNFPTNFDVVPYTPNAEAAVGVYNISGSATTDLRRVMIVAAFGGGTGTVNQTGGTIDAGGVMVGREGTGTWNMSAGVLNQTGLETIPADNNFIVGRQGFRGDPAEGTGNFNQSGGAVSVATNVFLGDFDNSEGTYRISSGTLDVTGNVSVGGALASNAPDDGVRVDPTGPDDAQGQALDANGTFIVSGSVSTIDIGGNFVANPADKHPFRTDANHVNGDNSATLIFEIFDASGTSLIDVGGVADLDGAVIDLDLMGGFTPSIGATFDLLTASSFGATGSGTTQNVGTGQDFILAAEDVGSFSLAVVGGGNGSILQATFLAAPMGVPGDYNDNGVVDAADYVLWRKNEGTSNSLANDPIGGTIGQDHYDQWVANFGNTSPGSGSGALSAVPEPASWMLLAIGAGLGLFRRKKQQANGKEADCGAVESSVTPVFALFLEYTSM